MSGEERGWDLLALLSSKAALASAIDLLYRSPLAPLHNGYILPFGKKKIPTETSSGSEISARKVYEDASLAGAELTSSSYPSVRTGADPEVCNDKGINAGRSPGSRLRSFPSHLAPYLW